jgi:hypothetical protein
MNSTVQGRSGARSGRALKIQHIAVLLGQGSGSRLLADQIETLRLRGAPPRARPTCREKEISFRSPCAYKKN